MERPTYDAEVNVIGTLACWRRRANRRQVVFTSTGGAIYGECEQPAREDDPRLPLSPYGMSKLAGEEYLAGLEPPARDRPRRARLANVYGPRQLPKLEGGVIAIFLDRMAAGQETVVFGDGLQSRDFVHVGDVARALVAAIGAAPGVYNVGTGLDTTIVDLHGAVPAGVRDAGRADVRRTAAGRDPPERPRPGGGGAWSSAGRPRQPLEAGLRMTWESTAG